MIQYPRKREISHKQTAYASVRTIKQMEGNWVLSHCM